MFDFTNLGVGWNGGRFGTERNIGNVKDVALKDGFWKKKKEKKEMIFLMLVWAHCRRLIAGMKHSSK